MKKLTAQETYTLVTNNQRSILHLVINRNPQTVCGMEVFKLNFKQLETFKGPKFYDFQPKVNKHNIQYCSNCFKML